MAEELELNLPVARGEPKPWTVSVWRYHAEEREPYLRREDAIEACAMMSDWDNCYVEGIYGPDGELDEAATDEAIPWRKGFREKGLTV